MAKETEIVNLINSNLLATTMQDKRFQKGSFKGLAEIIIRDEGENQVQIPCIVDNYGECTDVFIDDRFPIQAYHLMTGFKAEEIQEEDFGNPGTMQKQTATMVMIVAGYRPTLQLSKFQLLPLITSGFLNQLTAQQISSLSDTSIKSAYVSEPEIGLDKQEIFSSETGINDLYLQPEYILLKVDYTIETIIATNCVSSC